MSSTLQMTVSIRNNSVASFCEEYVLRRVFGFHLTGGPVLIVIVLVVVVVVVVAVE